MHDFLDYILMYVCNTYFNKKNQKTFYKYYIPNISILTIKKIPQNINE